MKLKKILFLIVFTAVIFCSSFYIQKWIMKSKTDTPSSINTSSSNLDSKPSISPVENENKLLTTVPSEAPTSTPGPTISVQPTTAAGDGFEKLAEKPTTTPTASAAPTPSYTPTPEQTGEADVITTMHQMSNGFIIAVDGMIWGVTDMTKNKISELTEVINKNNFNNKSILLQILKRWDNGDFSKIVEDHNTLWEYLNGSVGRAERPNEKIVNGKYPDFK